MFNLAIIGTNWISQQFVEASIQTGEFRLKAVYSREFDKARSFGAPYHAETFYDSLDALGNDPDIDAVYIASPNSLHAPQALQMLKAGKHVICEKPMASNYALAQRCLSALKKMKSCFLRHSCRLILPTLLC